MAIGFARVVIGMCEMEGWQRVADGLSARSAMSD